MLEIEIFLTVVRTIFVMISIIDKFQYTMKIWRVVVVPPEKTDNQKDVETMVPAVPMVAIN